MRVFSKIIKTSALVVLAGALISANQHLQTSADPVSKMLRISYLDEVLQTKLSAPGTTVEKDATGRLKRLGFYNVQTYYDVTFHPSTHRDRERVAGVKRFRVFGDDLLLHGPSYTFDGKGHKLTERNWHEGKLHGTQREWSNDHQLVEERHYDEGYPVGTWTQHYGEGGVAGTRTFPKNSSLWQETKVHRSDDQYGNENALHGAALHRSLTAKEQWYNPAGTAQREQHYRTYSSGNGVVLEGHGATVTYGPRGEVQRVRKMRNGSGTQTRYHHGRNPYSENALWLNGTQVQGTYDLASPTAPFGIGN